jgi:hypothetical protein
MKPAIRCVLLCSALSFSAIAVVAQTETKDSFPLADVIAQVKKELAATQNTPGQMRGLVLQSVQINFALTQATDVNGKVAIGVPIISADVGANGERKSENSSSLTVELAPPSASVTMSGTDSSQFGITQAILSTRSQLAKGLNDEPKLEPRKVSIQLKFGITRTGGATGQIKFLVFTVGGGATKSAAETSTITLNFEKK